MIIIWQYDDHHILLSTKIHRHLDQILTWLVQLTLISPTWSFPISKFPPFHIFFFFDLASISTLSALPWGRQLNVKVDVYQSPEFFGQNVKRGLEGLFDWSKFDLIFIPPKSFRSLFVPKPAGGSEAFGKRPYLYFFWGHLSLFFVLFEIFQWTVWQSVTNYAFWNLNETFLDRQIDFKTSFCRSGLTVRENGKIFLDSLAAHPMMHLQW